MRRPCTKMQLQSEMRQLCNNALDREHTEGLKGTNHFGVLFDANNILGIQPTHFRPC